MLAASAAAETVRLSANLQPSSEVPPGDKAPGDVEATYDTATHMLQWKVTTNTSRAGHRRALPRTGAGRPERGRAGADPEGGAGEAPIETGRLTDAQVTDLMGGKWYFNVHTKEHPAGEIRGR